MKKINNAYAHTKVEYLKSQAQIIALLNNNDIEDTQFGTIQGTVQLVFIKDLVFEGKKVRVGVKIRIPNVTDKNRNQLYRALFYYLKAKFESLSFGFVEEYNEAFVKEFMPYLVTDRNGGTVSDFILPKLNNALPNLNPGEQLFLEDKGGKDE